MTEGSALDLSGRQRIHIVGVGGSGMNAIATLLDQMGHEVTGSDVRDSPVLRRLRRAGLDVRVGHSSELATAATAVVHSTAVPAEDPELTAAIAAAVPVFRRSQALAAICSQKRTIAVGGTHGKTTTSAMLSMILQGVGEQPSWLVGGEVAELGAPAQWGSGDWFVVEADESDGTFLDIGAYAVIVTSVEPDHLDHFGDFAGLKRAFHQFVAAAPGPRVVCADEPGAARLAAPATTYGESESADYRFRLTEFGRLSARFSLQAGDVDLGAFDLAVPGRHNVANATAALAMAMEIGIDVTAARKSIAAYRGVGRRFEQRGERDGIVFVDDYGHLPGEVKATLAAARAGGWSRIVAVFQPHRYSRTESLWADFADAFDDADIVMVTDIYPAGEAPRPGISGQLIADSVSNRRGGRGVWYYPDRSALVSALLGELRAGDLCLTLGAGDLTALPDELLGGRQ